MYTTLVDALLDSDDEKLSPHFIHPRAGLGDSSQGRVLVEVSDFPTLARYAQSAGFEVVEDESSSRRFCAERLPTALLYVMGVFNHDPACTQQGGRPSVWLACSLSRSGHTCTCITLSSLHHVTTLGREMRLGRLRLFVLTRVRYDV